MLRAHLAIRHGIRSCCITQYVQFFAPSRGQVTRAHSAGRHRRRRGPTVQALAEPKLLTIVHFNDVYNIEERPQEPVGGAARFTHAVKQLAPVHPLVLFSGDVFNPSLISAFTRGEHMVPVLNGLGVRASVVGNHDFDFGLEVLQQHLADSSFPWILSNVLDTTTGQPLGGAVRTHVLTWQGVRIGLLGLAEREWLHTIPTLDDTRVQYLDFVEEGGRLARQLWEEEEVDCVIALTHMRTHNDRVLAASVPAIQLVLGGHDHHFEVTKVKPHGTLLIKSGTDFREFSVLSLTIPPLPSHHPASSTGSSTRGGPSSSGSRGGGEGYPGEDRHWCEGVPRPGVKWRRVEITSQIPPDPQAAAVVQEYMALIDTKMDEPLGWSHVALDARYEAVRCGESNVGNLFADVLRLALQADAAFFNGGTIRSDQVHAAGQLCMRDFVGMLPFTDELVLLELSGEEVLAALETGVGSYPKLEGRFLQVSGISFRFDPSQPPGRRVVRGSVSVAGHPLGLQRKYKVATKAYLRGGRDGFECLKEAHILVDGETAPRLATLVQFLLTRVQELNDGVEGDHHTHTPAHLGTPPSTVDSTACSAADDGVVLAQGSSSSRRSSSTQNGHGPVGQGGEAGAEGDEACATRGGGDGQGWRGERVREEEAHGPPQPGLRVQRAQQHLHSTVSSSATLESEVFMVDGAASSSTSSSPLGARELEGPQAAGQVYSMHSMPHHSPLDCLYCWDPVGGKYGIAPRLEGRIVRVGCWEEGRGEQ